MKNKLIWLDDYRNPLENNWLVFSPIEQPFEVVWVKNYKEFINEIKTNGLPNGISFDHDLGLGKSGYDCAKWLVEYCLDNKMKLPLYNMQSANSVGKANIDGLFKSFLKHN